MRASDLALVCLLAIVAPVSASAREAAIATIDVSSREGGVALAGRVVALAAGTYDASMTIAKSGPSGTTRTTQGASIELESGGTGTIATVGLSLTAGDRLTVELVVTAGGAPVAAAELTVGG